MTSELAALNHSHLTSISPLVSEDEARSPRSFFAVAPYVASPLAVQLKIGGSLGRYVSVER